MSLSVCVDGAGHVAYLRLPERAPPLLPLVFDLWSCLTLSVRVDGQAARPCGDEATRLPFWCSQWASLPAFPCWHIDPSGVLYYSPSGFLDLLCV